MLKIKNETSLVLILLQRRNNVYFSKNETDVQKENKQEKLIIISNFFAVNAHFEVKEKQLGNHMNYLWQRAFIWFLLYFPYFAAIIARSELINRVKHFLVEKWTTNEYIEFHVSACLICFLKTVWGVFLTYTYTDIELVFTFCGKGCPIFIIIVWGYRSTTYACYQQQPIDAWKKILLQANAKWKKKKLL